jgi:hypothetical protein
MDVLLAAKTITFLMGHVRKNVQTGIMENLMFAKK